MATTSSLTFETLCAELKEILPEREVYPEEELVSDLGLDSLALYELVVRTELLADVELPDELIDATRTLGDLHAWVVARMDS